MKTRSLFGPETLLLAALVLSALGPGAGCALYRMEKDLPPAYASFLSEVRYLITTAERKAFLSAPDNGKDRFIEEFWKRRDPFPATPENELRNEYYSRITQADDLFKTDAPQGWLSDRGRIYVLYGPPTERRTMTLSETATSRRIEVWYYGGVPITFRDVSGTGSYQLETLDLSQIQDLNLARAGEPGRTGYRSPGPLGRYSPDAQPLLDFSGEIREKLRLESRIEGLLRLEIPVRLIWFKSEGGRFQTTFEAVVRIRDGKNAVVWEKTTSAEAIYAEREIAARSGERHVIEIPILIDQAEAVAKLASSPVTVVVRLTNRTGSETVEKTIEWK